MSDGLDLLQSRISQISALIGSLAPSAPQTSTTPTSASGQFAGALSQALGSSGATAANAADAATTVATSAAVSTGIDSPVADAALGRSAVSVAGGYLGVPYRWGGTNPSTGLDCSGLTQLVFGKLGVALPRVAADQSRVGTAVPSLAQAEPGDLVFFGTPAEHVGIYVGDGKMIDAPHTGAAVGIHPVWTTPSAIRRIGAPGQTPVTAGSPATANAGTLSGPYAADFTAAGERYGVDPALLSAVAKAESGYDPSAVSPAGAQGLMQLMPTTAGSLGVDARNPAQAIDGAARLLSGLLSQYGGNTDLTLAAYNAGPGAVSRYGGVPPYPETQTYVRRVTSYWEALR